MLEMDFRIVQFEVCALQGNICENCNYAAVSVNHHKDRTNSEVKFRTFDLRPRKVFDIKIL